MLGVYNVKNVVSEIIIIRDIIGYISSIIVNNALAYWMASMVTKQQLF